MKKLIINPKLLSDDIVRDIVGGGSGGGGPGHGGGGGGHDDFVTITDTDNNIVYQGLIRDEPYGIAKNLSAKQDAGVWTVTYR